MVGNLNNKNQIENKTANQIVESAEIPDWKELSPSYTFKNNNFLFQKIYFLV